MVESGNKENNRSLNISVSTNVGKFRKNNEDNFYVDGYMTNNEAFNDFTSDYKMDLSENRIFAVCDGMGGESFGEVASECAVNVLDKYRKQINSSADLAEQKKNVAEYATAANNEICDKITASGGIRGGTTLTLACIQNNIVSMYYLGDSRIYLLRDNVITRITRDHTVAYQKIDANIYTEEEAEKSPDAHKLTLFLGVDTYKAGIKAEYAGAFTLKTGDKFLLCTDGLTDMCSNDEIKQILDMDCVNTAKELVDSALDNAGRDNVTCIVIEVI